MGTKVTILGALLVAGVLLHAPISRADQSAPNLWSKGQGSIQKGLATKYVPGELLVKFKEKTPPTKMQVLHSALQAQEIRQITPLAVRKVKLPSDISVEEAVATYEADSNVEYAEPNYIIHFMATIPDDPEFQRLWALHNTGQEVNGITGTADADMDAPEAWDITTGSHEVIVAVVDTGVAYQHPEMSPNMWANSVELDGVSGVDDDGNGYVDDIYGWDFWDDDGDPMDYNEHGTRIAGIIAARGNNGIGITGINWDARIMALRTGGLVATVEAVVEAILYAVDNGAHIINASWGGSDYSQAEHDAIDYANVHGLLFVAAAGNTGGDNDQIPEYPASYDLPNIISVAATDQDDALADFSNYGIHSVDVAAPGINIYSTVPEFSYGTPENLYTEDFDNSPTGWVSGGIHNEWAFTPHSFGETYCLEDSPDKNYSNNTESFAGYETLFDSEPNSRYTLSFKLRADLEYRSDFFTLIGSDGSGMWFLPDLHLVDLGNYRTGTTTGFIDDAFDLTALADVLPGFSFGFYLYSDESITPDGVCIDNLALYREPINISSYGYDYIDGTSIAAPHVAGLAALVKAQNPGYTHFHIRDAILNTVDTKPSLSAKLVTGGRINAFEAVTYIAAPTNVEATPGDGVVLLTWNTNGETAVTGYKISYGLTTALGTEIEVGNEASYEVKGLSNEVSYCFTVRVVGEFPGVGVREGTDSAIVTATPTALTAPNGLSATTVSTSQIDLSWTHSYYGETGFKIERRRESDADYSQIATINENVTTYSDMGLGEATAYSYRVRAYTANGESDYSEEVSATTLPAAPSGLSADAISAPQLDLSWMDNSSGESGFKIERKTGSSGAYSQIATTIADETTYSDTSVNELTTYCYRVRAYNQAGNSEYSNESTATTPSASSDNEGSGGIDGGGGNCFISAAGYE